MIFAAFLFVALFAWLLFGGVAGAVAVYRGANGYAAFLCALFLGPLGIVIAFVLPPTGQPGPSAQAQKAVRRLAIAAVGGPVAIVGGLLALWIAVNTLELPTADQTRLDYGAFYQRLERDQVQTFHAIGYDVSGDLTSGNHYTTTIPNRDPDFVQVVAKHVRGGVTWGSP